MVLSKEIEQDGFITRSEDLKKSEPKFQRGMVLIKDMEMPFSCDRCRLKDSDHSECKVAWKRVGMYGVDFTTGRPKWCPLTEVVAYGPEGTLYKEK